MFSASLLVSLSAYGLAFVSAYSSVNSSSSSASFDPVISNFSLLRTNFSGWNLGSSGGVTRLLNSLSAMSPTVATRTLAVPSCDTVTVTFAFIVSYVTVASEPLTSSTV